MGLCSKTRHTLYVIKDGRLYLSMSNCKVFEYFDFQQCFNCLIALSIVTEKSFVRRQPWRALITVKRGTKIKFVQRNRIHQSVQILVETMLQTLSSVHYRDRTRQLTMSLGKRTTISNNQHPADQRRSVPYGPEPDIGDGNYVRHWRPDSQRTLSLLAGGRRMEPERPSLYSTLDSRYEVSALWTTQVSGGWR